MFSPIHVHEVWRVMTADDQPPDIAARTALVRALLAPFADAGTEVEVVVEESEDELLLSPPPPKRATRSSNRMK